ncbi:MAG: nickel pincer cofactor biosynthesis protein LarC [Planctomycetota bacterium]
MVIGYLDCFSGISGDMCLGAIVDAGVPLEVIEEALGGLPMSGYSLMASRVMRGGISATLVEVKLDESEHHPHRGLTDVLAIIEGGSLPADVVERSSAVFRALAEAEAHVHNTDVDSVHFHEVGAVDAICDIVGTVVGLRELGLDTLKFSTVMLGGGTVRASHGVLPVPAPATVELLKGLPTDGGPVDFELTTPTGAAILKALGEPSPNWPSMTIERVGYGAGGRDVEAMPNVLRLVVGAAPAGEGTESDCVWVLEANLDDMTGEEIGYCVEKLMEGGALEAFTTPAQMKKNRPGVLLTVLCAPADLPAMEGLLWRHTSTLGVRRLLWQRSKLRRDARTVRTPWGEVRVKVAYLGDQVVRCEPEYEDCKEIADAHDIPLRRVYRAARAAAEPSD